MQILQVKIIPVYNSKFQGIIYADNNGERDELTTAIFNSKGQLKIYLKKLSAKLKNTSI